MSRPLSVLRSLLGGVAIVCAAPAVSAHIRATAPEPRVDDSGLKAAPCGAGNVWGQGPTHTFAPGEQIMMTWDETILHPGYFRVAVGLAGDASFTMPSQADFDTFSAFYRMDTGTLPDPVGTPEGQADGDMLVYYDYWAPHGLQECGGDESGGACSYEVALTLPDECEQCTLQLIQMMVDPGRNYDGAFYYSCIDFDIDPALGGDEDPVDMGAGATPNSDDSGNTDAQGTGGDTGEPPPEMPISDGMAGSPNQDPPPSNPPPMTPTATPMMPTPDPVVDTPAEPTTVVVEMMQPVTQPPATAMPSPSTTASGMPSASSAPVMMTSSGNDDGGGCSVAPSGDSTTPKTLGWLLTLVGVGLWSRRRLQTE